jgi:hypothetical protein
MRSLSLLVAPLALIASLGAQSVPVATAVLEDLCLVEYGADLSVRDVLIRDGGFYGDLGRAGVARLSPVRFDELLDVGVRVTAIPEVRAGEALLAIARNRAGVGPIHGRLLLARRGYFLSAAVPSELPEDCGGSGFHGGLQIVPLDRPYSPTESNEFALPEGPADPAIAAMVGQVQAANLQAHVTALSAIQTRRATQPENAQAVQYVVNQLAVLPSLTWRTESFSSSYGPNVIAELPGTDLANEIVMIGAHLDSIAGTSTSSAPGADDNASGSAAVLEIARIFAGQQFRRTVRFGWWNAEEFGLVGSGAYAAAAAARGDVIIAYVNTDMNAYRAPGDVLSVDFISNDSTPSLVNALIQATQTYLPGVPTNVGSLSGGTSDHRSFFRNGFPAAFPFEDIGQYSPYIHTTNDTVGVSANDFQLATLITQSVLAGTAELAEIALGTPGAFVTFGQGCPGTGSIAATCGAVNTAGGALQGDVRTNEYAYLAQNAGPARVASFDVFSQSTTGGTVTVGAALYADAGGLPAALPLASTTVAIGSTPGFYTATLPAPVDLQGPFWIAVDHSAQTTVLANLTAGTLGTGAWRRPPGTGPWSLSSLITYPSFRVDCGPGTPNAVPRIGSDGVAVINRTFVVTLDHAAPGAPAALFLGASDVAWTGGLLPTSVPLAPGCTVLVSAETLDWAVANADGSASHSFALPDVASLVGVDVFHQWVVLDAGANPLGLAFSAGARSTIGG